MSKSGLQHLSISSCVREAVLELGLFFVHGIDSLTFMIDTGMLIVSKWLGGGWWVVAGWQAAGGR